MLPDVIANVAHGAAGGAGGPDRRARSPPVGRAAAERVAFVQCAGSRDVNHLPYCSAVCCLASLKQAMYVHEQLPETEVTIYYIDRRTPGRNEDCSSTAAALTGRDAASRARSAKVEADGDGLLLTVEDVDGRQADCSRRPTWWCWPPGMVPQPAGRACPSR